jgi:hypothetical protein
LCRRERRTRDYESELRNEKWEAFVDPIRRRIRARDDRKYTIMRLNPFCALRGLDWDEIDQEPIPNRSWSRGSLALGDDGAWRDESIECLDDDNEEEYDNWVCSTVWYRPGQLGLTKLSL